MNRMTLSSELDAARDAAVRAGQMIMGIYARPFDITYKEDRSPLTEADRASNAIIVPALTERFPLYAMLSEESKDNLSRLDNPFCWVVDPLDGTKEFIKRNGEFTVNIALIHHHRTVLGVIYVPASEELYYAMHGEGAYYEKDGQRRRIQVSNRTQNIRMVMSRSHASETLTRLIEKYAITETISAGSSLKGCLVARGDAEVYYRPNPTMEWDTAAMHCIAEEAGALFRQSDDSEMLYNRENSLNEQGFYIINRIENKLTLV